MSTGFGGFETRYHFDSPVKEKLKTEYTNPSTRSVHSITIRYKYNENVPTALENQLLRDSQYSSWEEKEKVLIPMASDRLDKLENFLPTVTALSSIPH